MKIKIIITATDSTKVANIMSECLVKNNLSPCVQIVPNIKSVYNWKGTFKKSDELLLFIKTISENVQDCKKLILQYHNHDVPEIIISDGDILNDTYRDWFIQNTKRP